MRLAIAIGRQAEFQKNAGYCARAPVCGASVSMHRIFNPATGDHLYTTDAGEVERLRGDASWLYEHVECYVWPTTSASSPIQIVSG